MIDLVAFKQRLSDCGPWIEPADLITEEAVRFLSQYSAQQAQTLFKKSSDRPPLKWQWEQRCPTCDVVWIAIGPKTDALKYIQFCGLKPADKRGLGHGRSHWKVEDAECVDCKRIGKAIKEAEPKLRRMTNEELLQDRRRKSEQFIEWFLDAEKSWPGQSDMYGNFQGMHRILRQECDQDHIRDHIKEMDYNDFLQTPYWKAIAYECRRKAGWKCSLCSAKGTLHVHHRTYEIHGSEIDHIEKDLIVLCKQCHETFHSERQLSND